MTATATKSIESVKIVREPDDCPDISHLGEYSGSPGEPDRTIDRQERGEQSRGEYRYFIAAMSGEETGNPASVEQDYQRAEAFNRGEWHLVVIHARADIRVNGVFQSVTSGYIGGTESDSEEMDFEQIQSDQLSELRGILAALGFSAEEIDAAFAEVEIL
jgi:hypothetical protein